jgi:hypothetical protein
MLKLLRNTRDSYFYFPVSEVLITLADPDTIEPLCHMLLSSEDVEQRCFAAKILRVLPHPHSTAALIEALREDPDADVAGWSAYALGELRAVEAIKQLTAATFDFSGMRGYHQTEGEPLVCYMALDALLEIGTDEAKEVVLDWGLRNIRCKRWMVPSHAAEYLGKVGDRRAIPYLKEALYAEEWWTGPLAHEAENALRKINTPVALAALEEWESRQPKRK